MSVKVTGVDKHSPAARARIKAGDTLISINGHAIADVLDYMFYAAEDRTEVVCERDGKERKSVIYKSEYDDLGMQFDSFLMDQKRSCSNKCIFCFIDQMPPGMLSLIHISEPTRRS